MNRLIAGMLIVGLGASLGLASAAPPASISGRLSLTGLFYAEQEGGLAQGEQPEVASPAKLLFGDLRALLIGTKLKNRVDFRLDGRLRLTGSFDYERKFSSDYFVAPASYLSARGYLGGPEYDLREAWAGIWLTHRVMLQLGRMFVAEADMSKTDGLRVKVLFGEHWEGSAFAGGYPNPYSRSIFNDYEPPCAAGVASGNTVVDLAKLREQNPLDISPGLPQGAAAAIRVAADPCQTGGPELALVGGLTARYQYSRIWGHIGLAGTFLGGNGDGGPVQLDTALAQDRVGNLQAGMFTRDPPRIFLTWQDQLHPTERLDLFSDLVVDFFGSNGPQLTRAILVGNVRLLMADRLSLRATYSYLSSLAIDMFLNRLLYNRFPNGTTLGGTFGIVENNLTVLRTGRHEGRLSADLRLFRMLQLWVEGRVRHRSLIGAESNPAVYQEPSYLDNQMQLAGDATVGLRDGGSLKQLRGSMSYTFLQDYRARNHVLRLALGRSLWRDQLNLDVDYLALLTTDRGVDQNGCARNLEPKQGMDTAAQLDSRISAFLPDCFGRRSGSNHEIGATLTLSPGVKLFLMADYRFAVLLSDRQGSGNLPTVFAHSVLARVEVGF